MTKSSIDHDKKFLNRSKKQPYLNKEDEKLLIKKWQLEKDSTSLNKIVLSHLRLIISIASKFKNYGLPINELVQEGNIDLCRH